MKDRIRKILKEAEDEFECAHGLDVDSAIKEVQSSWLETDDEYNTDILDIYETLVDSGFHNVKVLKQIGKELYSQFHNVYERGDDNGRYSGDCEGCCDALYSWDSGREQVDDAKESAYDEGFDRGREEMETKKESEIDELNSKIEELKERIQELENRDEE